MGGSKRGHSYFILNQIIELNNFDKIFLAPKEDWFFTNQLFCKLSEWLNLPMLCLDNSSLEIINIKLAGQFTTHIFISFAVGFFASSPYIIFEFCIISFLILCAQKKSMRGTNIHISLYHNFGKGLYECWIF